MVADMSADSPAGVRKLVAATMNEHKVAEISAIAGSFGYSVISRAEAGVPDFEIEEDGATFEENALIKAGAIFDWFGGGTATVADDSGLEVDALGGAPGVYSARFAGLAGGGSVAGAGAGSVARVGASGGSVAGAGDTTGSAGADADGGSVADLEAAGVDAEDFAEADRDAGHMFRSRQDRANNAKLLRLLKDVPAEKRSARFVSVIACFRPGKAPVVCRGEVEGHIGFEASGSAGFGYDPLFIPLGYEYSFGHFLPVDKNKISHRGRALALLAERLAEE